MSDEETKPAVELPPGKMPGRFGGILNRGGVQPGAGRPPNVIRDGLRKNLLKTARRMEQTVRNIQALIEKRQARHLRELEKAGQDPSDFEDYGKALDDQERLLNAQKTLNDFLAKYGIGMTFTETTRDGNDIPRPVIYLPSNGRGNSDN